MINMVHQVGQNIIWIMPVIITFIFLWFIVAIVFAVWMYRDAESRGMNGVLWLIVALIAGIIGLIIYLIVREPKRPLQPMPSALQPEQPVRHCINCGRPLSPNAVFCPHCGKPQV